MFCRLISLPYFCRMKEQGTYEEHYFISGTTGYDCEGYKITFNGKYCITCKGYNIGGKQKKISVIPMKSLTEAKAMLKKLKERRKKFNFNLED